MLEQSKSWLDMQNCNFIEIANRSLLPKKWKDWSLVSDKYNNSILKPINMYSDLFGIKPKLESIDGNKVTLSQYTHADIYLLINYDKSLYAIDKPHQRQFYMSSNNYTIDDKDLLSNQCFRFYLPWIIDYNLKANIFSNKKESFLIIPKEIEFTFQEDINGQRDTDFIDFYFTSHSSHMIEDDCGIIERGTYMYSISFIADDLIIKKIMEFYDK